eukprot:TRINITY_DN17659_c0_g1_i1.p1 TRINITY_DN17659_c0_g1~~TRINITY_DN17659_c0_g1_i1.p1  ORF type:complete len:117 (-),score=11.69 TRINITY_DN17659_c0_g1_i1:116-466(-)
MKSANQKCPTCGKTVYFAERVVALNKDYHKLCLKCVECNKKLEPGNFSDRDDRLFCKGCYSKTKGGATGFRGAGATGVAGVYDLDEQPKQVDTKKCQCGAIHPLTTKFCSECGHSL